MTKKKRWVPAKEVRVRYGNASDMSLWRWSHDPGLGFPPVVYINNRRYWDEAQLDAFDARLVRDALRLRGEDDEEITPAKRRAGR